MVLPKIEERTLYPPIISYLDKIEIKALSETKVVTKHPDILFNIDSIKFVIEVKIGKPEIGLKAIAQASDYAKKLNTQNVIILIYPEKCRNQIILKPEDIEKIALEPKEGINALIQTDYLVDYIENKPLEYIFKKIKDSFLLKEPQINFKVVVKQIKNYVGDLNSIIYQIKIGDELISEVVNKLDLFTSIGEIKDRNLARNQVINLASYLLFNQLLFYHIYKRKTNRKNLPDLEEIENVKQIQKYFDAIISIDYQAIYKTNILGHIPNENVVIEALNDVIKSIKLLRVEHITHDLAGRFFHDLIPHEVRKVLAAFYTHPIAAEILANLSIDSWDDLVIDPACGSGTLLVASYIRKLNLYKELYGLKDLGKIHKKFIENDITGIDIMPFAGHISTINLTTQNIEEETNIVRISSMNSLLLSQSLKNINFKTEGIQISPYSESIQETLFGASKVIKKEGALSPRGIGSYFWIKPVDVVIMNPPFTDRTRLPKDILDKLKKNKPLNDICGSSINLWGAFLALGDLLLKSEGRLSAVVPINLLRGKTTEKIREFLFTKYHIKYIIKPVADLAFSESASFRDILFIAEKRNPTSEDFTVFVMLKNSIKKLNDDETKKIINKIEELDLKNSIVLNDNFEAFVFKQKEIQNFKNLMPLFSANNINSNRIFNNFLEKLKNKSTGFKIDYNNIKEGFLLHKGISKLILTRNLDESRILRAESVIDKENPNTVIIKQKNIKNLTIDKDHLTKTFRSITGIKNMDISKREDYLITKKLYDKNKFITDKINLKELNNEIISKGNTYIILPHKINIISPNTHLLAFYSYDGVIPTSKFYLLKGFTRDDSKILTLCFNSIVGLMQILLYRSETMGFYCGLSGEDYSEFIIINPSKLDKGHKQELLNLFDEIKEKEFPSIIKQLENRFKPRVELDTKILEIFGFSKKEINEWLPKVYDAIIDELKVMKDVK